MLIDRHVQRGWGIEVVWRPWLTWPWVRKDAPALKELGAGVYGGIKGRTSDVEGLISPVFDDLEGPSMAAILPVFVDTGSRGVSVARLCGVSVFVYVVPYQSL